MNWIKLEKISESANFFENIYSMVVFKMEHSYRPFNKYVDDLNKTLEQNMKYTPEWGNILYIDYFLVKEKNSDIINLIKKYYKKIDMYTYVMPNLILNDYHIGTVGTMVRFIPLFENNKYKTIWSMDIDFADAYAQHIQCNSLPHFLKSSAQVFCGLNSYGDQLKKRTPDRNKFVIYAGSWISKIKFPAELLNNYMKDIIENKIRFGWDITKSYKYHDTHLKFPYGGDEWFLNTDIYNYLIDSKIPVMVEFKATPEILLYKLNKNYKMPDKYNSLLKLSLTKQTPNILKNILIEGKQMIRNRTQNQNQNRTQNQNQNQNRNRNRNQNQITKYLNKIYEQKEFYETKIF